MNENASSTPFVCSPARSIDASVAQGPTKNHGAAQLVFGRSVLWGPSRPRRACVKAKTSGRYGGRP